VRCKQSNGAVVDLSPAAAAAAAICRFNLADYYVGEHGRDFVCSGAADSGMTKCAQIPPYVDGALRCNDSARPHAAYSPLPPGPPSAPLAGNATGALAVGRCVDWHRYYRVCKPAGSNPFHGSISFDNIGLAWVAIFQVFVILQQLKQP